METMDVPERWRSSSPMRFASARRRRPGVRMVQGKDLIEVKMVFNCDWQAPACMAQSGKSLGTDKLLYGVIKKGSTKTTFSLALKLLDVKSGAVEKFVNDTARSAIWRPAGQRRRRQVVRRALEVERSRR